jgi:hypothetical protein
LGHINSVVANDAVFRALRLNTVDMAIGRKRAEFVKIVVFDTEVVAIAINSVNASQLGNQKRLSALLNKESSSQKKQLQKEYLLRGFHAWRATRPRCLLCIVLRNVTEYG